VKGIKTKKKQFEETIYTFDEYQKEKFNSALGRKGINELNYIMITINCPKRFYIWEPKKQFDYLVNLLKSLSIYYVACIEWCDERSNGYHLHIIISKEDLNFELFPYELFIDDLFHKSVLRGNHCLDRCLGYLTKERKDCTSYNRKEKFYLTNIPERSLIPLALRSNITKEATEETIILEKIDYQVFKQRIKARKPKDILKSFFEKILKRVKRFFPVLFINKKTAFKNGNQPYNICQNTRDGPFG
jgi:hypothetical protein